MFNKMIAGLLPHFPKRLIWSFSKKYIAGAELKDAIRVSKELNAQGNMITVDVLGEFITNLDQADETRDEYLEVIEEFEKNKIEGNYSVKPTSFGLLLDEEKAYMNIRAVVAKAAEYGNFVRIDMEDSPCTDLEIMLYRRLKGEFPNNVGLVVQAYMRRTLQDIENLMDIHSVKAPTNYRLCKGIYIEPEEIAYKDFDEVNENYLKDLEYMFQNGIYAGIATHDAFLVDGAFKLIAKYNMPKDAYEFQMLYGVTPKLRQRVIDAGHKIRVYVPFGKDWFGYSTRRLKENPNIISHAMKSMLYRG
ncbi:MAG: proline dehydrogenase family protein [Flavobacteriales bacterium]|nr:proline dehydrogenase family protein [Flavobacteriales bacterium]